MRRTAWAAGSLALLLGVACGGPPDRGTTPVDTEPPRVTVALRITAAPDRPDGVPMNFVRLVLIEDAGQRDTADVGQLPGACTLDADDGTCLLRARCWWASEGGVVEVVRDGDRVVARVSGAAPGAPAEEAVSLALPPGAEVSAVR